MAGTVLLQRITSDHHWPSDVYGGAVYGWVISHALLKLKACRNVNMKAMASDKGEVGGIMITFEF